MNKETRRLSKFPDEVQAELEQYFMDTLPIVNEDAKTWSKRDDHNIFDHVQNGLTPRWSDLDINQHVNNVKYIGWIVEKYELASMVLEYSRECTKDNVLQSHTCILENNNIGGIADSDHVDCQHLLRLQTGGGDDVGCGG
ncbi:Acyl-ACP thioesterase, partial [Cynara cardunculus var. scolymus]